MAHRGSKERVESNRTKENDTEHNTTQHGSTRRNAIPHDGMHVVSYNAMQCSAVQCMPERTKRTWTWIWTPSWTKTGLPKQQRKTNANAMQNETEQNRTVPMDGWNPRNQKPDRNERVSVDDRMQNIVLHCISVQYVEEYERPTGMLVRPGNPLCLSLLYYTLSICIYATPRSPSRRGTHERNGP